MISYRKLGREGLGEDSSLFYNSLSKVVWGTELVASLGDGVVQGTFYKDNCGFILVTRFYRNYPGMEFSAGVEQF